MTIDTAGSPGLTPEIGTFSDQASRCDLNVISGGSPVSYSVRRSSAANPAWVCVEVEGTHQQVELGVLEGVEDRHFKFHRLRDNLTAVELPG